MTGDNANIRFKISDAFKRDKELELLLANKKGDEIILAYKEYQCLMLLYKQYRRISDLGNWVELISACKKSGKTITAWCEEMRIPRHRYYYWRHKIQHVLSESFENSKAR